MRSAALLMLLAVWLPLCAFAQGHAHAVDQPPFAGEVEASPDPAAAEPGVPGEPEHSGHRHPCSGACCCTAPPLLPTVTPVPVLVVGTRPAPGPVTAASVPLPLPTSHLLPEPNAPPRPR